MKSMATFLKKILEKLIYAYDAFLKWKRWQQIGAIITATLTTLGSLTGIALGIHALVKGPDIVVLNPKAPPVVPPVVPPTAPPTQPPQDNPISSDKPSIQPTPPPTSEPSTNDFDYVKQQRFALEAFYNATNGDNWNTRTNWMNDDKSICTWHGVTCDVNTGFVREVDLFGLGHSLNGTLPSELGLLESVETLRFHGHYLKDATLPKEFSRLTNLKHLQFSSCKLGGTIPPEYRSLTNLQVFDMRWNDLTSGFPESIGEITSLQKFLVRYATFRYDIPTTFGNLLQLKELDLYAVKYLSGTVPTEIGRLTNLEKLYLAGTKLTGSLPIQMKNLTNLEELSLPESINNVPTEVCNLKSVGNLKTICQPTTPCACCQNC